MTMTTGDRHCTGRCMHTASTLRPGISDVHRYCTFLWPSHGEHRADNRRIRVAPVVSTPLDCKILWADNFTCRQRRSKYTSYTLTKWRRRHCVDTGLQAGLN